MAKINLNTGGYTLITSIEAEVMNQYGPITVLDAAVLTRIESMISTFSSTMTKNVSLLKEKLSYIEEINTTIQNKIDLIEPSNHFDSDVVNSLNGIVYELEELRPFINEFVNLAEKTLSDFESNQNVILYTSDTKAFITSLSDIVKNIKEKKLIFDRFIREFQKELTSLNTGRSQLNAGNQVDWDDDPTVFENTSIGLGHILIFKQVWKSDGYSIGDVEGSVVLQPMQIKQVATIDWTRTDTASRSEELANTEELVNTVTRDSDTREIINTALSESLSGKSKASSKSKGGSIGGSLSGMFGGAMLGISGGYQSSSQRAESSSSQSASRDLASNALQSLRDKIQQSAASVRSQRSTVIQTVSQSETATATTEIIANYNRRHALTTMWFSINRHFVIEQELADVQECLFFPLPMTIFNEDKIYRWRDILKDNLRDTSHVSAFDAIDRIVNRYEGVNFPNGRYCDENIDYMEGEFTISFEIPRIPDPDEVELEAAIASNEQGRIETATQVLNSQLTSLFSPFYYLLRRAFNRPKDAFLNKLKNQLKARRDYVYEKEIVPVMVNSIVNDYLQLFINDEEKKSQLEADFTLVDKYDHLVTIRNNYTGNGQYAYSSPRGRPLRVRFQVPNLQSITREDIKNMILRIHMDSAQNANPGSEEEPLPLPGLPDGVRVIVHSATIQYSTPFGSYSLFSNRNIKVDLDFKTQLNEDESIPSYDSAVFPTMRKSFIEVQNPKYDDKMKVSKLINHLNQNLEYYHRVIWMNMDTSRVFRLLDGYIAPNSGGRSVASVVESQPLGVIGNNLILKVVPGANLDPFFRINVANGVTLFDHYKPHTPFPAYRITTKNPGLYGESILGKCESAETIDDSKLWRYEDLKIPYLPSEIQPVSVDSRYQDPGNLQAKDFAQPMINMQTLTPDTLQDSAMKEALSLIGKGDSFRDVTGLAGTQGLVSNAQNQNTQVLKNATDAANTAMQTGANYSLEKQKQDLAAYEAFAKNANPEQKAALQQSLLESWGKDTKAVQEALNNANKIAQKQADLAASNNPNSSLKQTLDAAEPGTSVKATVNADGSTVAEITKKTDGLQWVRNNSEQLLEMARKYDLVQKTGEDNVCWAYALAVTLFPAIEFDQFSSNESIIEQVLRLAGTEDVSEESPEEEETDDTIDDHGGFDLEEENNDPEVTE